ncbi:MAG: hypothetical protein R3A50_15940 [Saprospiraceae bacterium]|nr:hypothetical protein [Saprospiraceae bacterium]MCB9344188.1 hypothetical protein [Lewinellaceae bacterium]
MRIFSVLFCWLFASSVIFSQSSGNQQVVSGIVLQNNNATLDGGKLLNSLRSSWKIKTDSVNISDKTIVFNSGLATVMIAQLNYPADPVEIKTAAKLSWMWPSADEETSGNKSQIVVSVIGPSRSTLDLHMLFTKVSAAILEITQSSAVYMSSRYLLVSKGFFSAAARNMTDNKTIPLYCWVYFGNPGNGGAFTFGMQEFGKPNLEIVQSNMSSSEIHSVIYDAALTIIKYNAGPDKEQALTTEEGSKLIIKPAKGVLLEGEDVWQLQF